MNNNKNQSREGIFLMVLRILVALVFIFSATVKGVDPIGTEYRVEDYLEAYSWYFMLPYSFGLGVLLILVEFLIGFALLFKLHVRLAALGVLLMMMFFTVVTWFDARYNLVTDCGCFGDAVKMTNWQTFYKNIVLIVLAIIIFIARKRMISSKPGWFQTVVVILFGGLFLGFIYENYNHLPMMDFRSWKIGNDMKSANLDKIQTYVTYRNKSTGETKEYLTPDYPWNDSVWMSNWEFVDQRVDESQVIRKHHLMIVDSLGNEYTRDIIENSGDQFLLVSYNLQLADPEGMKKATELATAVRKIGADFALVCANDPSSVSKYVQLFDISYPLYFADDIELKALIRSNPGLVHFRDGVIVDKWHYNDFPLSAEKAGIE